MKLQETIRRIIREETKPSLQLRRRINFDELDKIFYISLSNVTERFLKYKSKFNAMQFYKFKSMVISELIQNLGDTMSSSEHITPIFDELWELVTDKYSEKILERYNEIK